MNKKIIIILLCILTFGLSIGYAAISSNLNITGSAKLGSTVDNWNISFKNPKCTAYNHAEVGDIKANGTDLELSNHKLQLPSDYIICNFDIVNNGTIASSITDITFPDKNKINFQGSGSTKTIDEELVRNGLTIEMLYSDNSKIKIGDKLNAKETKKAYIKLSYKESETSIPTNNVTIGAISAKIVFGQIIDQTEIPVIEKGITTSYNVGDYIYYNPETNTINCSNYVSSNSLNENKSGCMKWYAIKDNDANLTAILDHNTTYSITWNTSGSNTTSVTADNKLASDVSNWNSEIKSTARMISANEIADIVGAKTSLNWSYDTSSQWFYFDGTGENWQTPTANSNKKSAYPWLYNYTYNCTSAGCDINDSNTSGYWTSSTHLNTTNEAWHVGAVGRLSPKAVNQAGYGLRPVITISKANVINEK